MMSSNLAYVVGDVHGSLDLLLSLLRAIEDHAASRPHQLIFLGDYIDRGPDSAGVIRTLRQLQMNRPEQVICLKGNHEDLMLRAVADPACTDGWFWNGGGQTLRSFGARSVADLPRDVIEWARNLPTSYEDERCYYVHAGLDPARPLTDQNDHDRMWIRSPFLDADHDFGKHIVHGHTPLQGGEPDARTYRTNLDTAAVFGGALTAGVFTGEQERAVAYLRVKANSR